MRSNRVNYAGVLGATPLTSEFGRPNSVLATTLQHKTAVLCCSKSYGWFQIPPAEKESLAVIVHTGGAFGPCSVLRFLFPMPQSVPRRGCILHCCMLPALSPLSSASCAFFTLTSTVMQSVSLIST